MAGEQESQAPSSGRQAQPLLVAAITGSPWRGCWETQQTDPDLSLHHCPCALPLPPEMMLFLERCVLICHARLPSKSRVGTGLASGPGCSLSDSLVHSTNLALKCDRQAVSASRWIAGPVTNKEHNSSLLSFLQNTRTCSLHKHLPYEIFLLFHGAYQ